MKMCQCPEWGDLHFYGLNVEDKSNNEGCVNALKGATFISTEQVMLRQGLITVCQCPERGDLHFYKAFHNAEGGTLATVSMP